MTPRSTLLAVLTALLLPAGLPAEAADPRPGRIFVFSGDTGLVIRTIQAPAGLRKARFGTALAGVGDVNGDNVPDIAVGAPKANNAGLRSVGMAYIFSGNNGSLLRTLSAPAPATRTKFGWSLAATGDLTGDGAGDLVVGAPGARVPGAGRPGEAYLLSGGDGSILATFRQPSPRKGSRFGSSAAAGVDSDGDGLPEIVLGAARENVNGRKAQGRAYAFDPNGSHLATFENPVPQHNALFGESLSFVPDIDGDGFSEIAIGADGQHAGSGDYAGGVFILRATDPNDPLVGFARAVPPLPQANFGFAVAGLADLDGDGAGDLAVTSPDQDGAAQLSGAAASFSGMAPDPNRLLSVTLGLVASLPHPEPGRVALFGSSLAALPDLTGDGLPEVIIGAELHKNTAGFRTGRAYVIEPVDGTLLFSVPSPSGDTCSRFGWSVASIGDVNGDSIGDFAVGAPFHREAVKQKKDRCF